jgi:hypothetical protein
VHVERRTINKPAAEENERVEPIQSPRHCEERSDEAIQNGTAASLRSQ